MGLVCKEFLKKLRLKAEEVALVDMEAGIEHFGRGIESSVDAVLVVVDLSREAVDLAGKTKEMSEASGARFAGAVLNKAAMEAMVSRLLETLHRIGIPVLATVPYEDAILMAGFDGQALPPSSSTSEVSLLAGELLRLGSGY